HRQLRGQGGLPLPHAGCIEPLDCIAGGMLPGRTGARLGRLCLVQTQLEETRAPIAHVCRGELADLPNPALVHPRAGPCELETRARLVAAPLERQISGRGPRGFATYVSALYERHAGLLAAQVVGDGEPYHPSAHDYDIARPDRQGRAELLRPVVEIGLADAALKG